MLRPRLGWLSGLALLALAVVQLAGIPADDPTLRNPLSHVWLATIWAGWSAAVWIATGAPLNLRRLAALAALLAWHCGIMELAREQPLQRYLIMFAGFSVVQVTLAILLRLPRWKLPAAGEPVVDSSQNPEPRPGQFGILGLLVLMTVVALIQWAIRSYGAAGGEQFLNGTVVALLLLTVVATTAIAAATIRRWGAALAVLMILVAAASAAVMARQERVATGGGNFAEFWRIYFTIEAIFGIILYGLGICGRLDAAAEGRGAT